MQAGSNRPPSIKEQDIDYSSKADGEQDPAGAVTKTARTTPTRITIRLRLVLNTTIFIFLGLYLVFFLYRAFIITTFPYPLDTGDGVVLSVASRLAAGNSIYKDITEPPYISANYTPLYYVFSALSIDLIGPSFLPGRSLSVIATFCLALLVFMNVRYKTGDKYAALIAGLAFISLGPVYTWGMAYKADMTAITLAVFGFTLLNRERPRPVLAALILLLAFFTKQTLVTALVAGTVYLGTRALRDKREGRQCFLIYILTASLVGLAFFAWLDISTGGQFFVHVLTLNVQQMLFEQAAYAMGVFVRSNVILLVVSLLISAKTLLQRQEGWSIYFLVALLALVSSVGKVGAYTNYFLESLAISCILFGLGLARWRRGPLGIVLIPLIILQLALQAHIPYLDEPTPTPKATDFEAGQQLIKQISSTDGPILAENAGWLGMVNHSIVIDDTFFFAHLARSGRWDQSKLVQMIQRKDFSLVLLEFDPKNPPPSEAFHLERFTAEMLDAIIRDYQVSQIVGNYYLLVPRADSWTS